jgi:UDP-glucose 4-epimerase
MLAWVIGAGGMLGSAIRTKAPADARAFEGSTVPWHDAEAAGATLAADALRFTEEAGTGNWAIVWAAGSSVVASMPEQTGVELRMLELLLAQIARATPHGPGVFFLTSSAGGVYAGSDSPPFDERTIPRPISPYGRLKLQQEELTARMLAGRVPVVIARFSNLYGSLSDPGKAQGLIQQLCRATVRRTPLNLYVSMDTVRDYLYVDDAAAMAWQAIEQAGSGQPHEPWIVVVASGQPTTVAQVVATIQNVAHRRVPLALGTHPSAQHQVVDLRLTPTSALVDARATMTTLPGGIKRVFDAIVVGG